MSPTIELADQLFETGPLAKTSSCVEWAYLSDEWCLRIEAHAPGVFRLRCGPRTWLEPSKPSLRVQRQADMLLARHEAVGEFESQPGASGGWCLLQGDAGLVIGGQGHTLQLMRQDQVIAQANLPLQPVADDDGPVWTLDWTLGETEGVFGLGETCGDQDRRGISLASDVADDRSLPLAWTPNGWGVYANTLDRVLHDLSTPSALQIQVRGKGLDLFLFVGEPSEILNQYTALTGRAGQPNLWPLGIWLDQAAGQSIDQSLLQVRSLRAQGMALDALRLANPAILGFQADKPVFEWSDAVTAEWRDIVAAAEEQNIHLAGSCIPGVLQGTALFDEWEDRGWLLCDDDGDAWVCQGTEASGGKPFGLLDLTHKDAARLWTERHLQALEDGLEAPVCQARFDFPDELEARGGESGAVLRSSYPHLARRALFDAVAGPRTPQEGVMLSRDLFPGVQRFAWQLGPEVNNDWDGYADTLRAALSVGNAGVAVQTHGLGCSQRPVDTMSPELYLRWLAMCVFSANFSFQGHPNLMPDAFDAPTRDLIKHWLEWRYRLLPYVAGIIDDAVRSGLPVQRSMAQSYPADPEAHAWDTQYLLGPALLVAPVMQPGEEIKVYLPKGDAWWDLSTGWRYEGGTRWTMRAGLDTMPVFGREGHILCLGPVAQHTGEINSAKILEEVWMFGMPEHNPVVMRNKIRVMQMQGSSYIKGLEGLKILPSEGLEVKRRGAEVRISRAR